MPEQKKAKLIGRCGIMQGQQWKLVGNEVTLGRDEDNQIVMRGDPSVSRHHCRIFDHLGFFWAEDLNSSNGTFLTHAGSTSLRLAAGQPAMLLDGSVLHICTAEFELIDVLDPQDDAPGMVRRQLQELLKEICKLLPEMSSSRRAAYENSLHELESHLQVASDEQELILVVSRDIQKLSSAFLTDDREQATVLFEPGYELPPMDESLLKKDGEVYIDSLKNMFFKDINNCLPPEEGENQP